jgi:hypothetical protein
MTKRHIKKCVLCGGELLDGGLTFTIAMEVPIRWDFLAHHECYLKSDEESLKKALKSALNDKKEYNL